MNYLNFIRTLAFTLVACSLTAGAQPLPDITETIAMGNEAWAQRAQGHQGSKAALEPIQKAIDAYMLVLDAEPENLEIRWKLLRAFRFKGEFVLDDDDARLILFKQGREIGRTGRKQVERQYGLAKNTFKMKPQDVASTIGKSELVAEFYFWSSANLGLWGRYIGKMTAAKEGVATKLRHLAEIMILLDDRVEDGGAHRLLGRLNTQVPRIPLVTGWVDRDLSINELRLSLEVAPHNLLAQFFLADALLKFRPEEKEEAMDILQDLVQRDPDPERLVEDINTIEDAEALMTLTLSR